MAAALPIHVLVGLCLLGVVDAQSAVITSPKQFLGKQVGADHFLANYTQLRGY